MRPIRVAGRQVEKILDEWRVVDRWWTDEPIHRRYCSALLADLEVVTLVSQEDGAWDLVDVEKRPRFRLYA